MAAKKKISTARKAPVNVASASPKYCNAPIEPSREFGPEISGDRSALIILSGNKWVAGTVLNFYFFDSPTKWKGKPAQLQRVRDAFDAWANLSIGIEFREVFLPHEAEIRIGFQRNDGHWSYLGRGVLQHGASKRTMNLDGDNNWDIDTAIHEIGHTLGFPHEHQNPNAGIVWDEERVYEALAKPPNRWSREKTRHNILRKINPETVDGSDWDKDSIMHYPFEAGLILSPIKYQTQPLNPAPGLSTKDKKMAKFFYPPLGPRPPKLLKPFKSENLKLGAGEQAHFRFKPEATRDYQFQTFGESDTVMVLFEMVDGEQRFRAGDDDSAEDRNAKIIEKLFSDREYVIRIRLYWAFSEGDAAMMVW